MKAVRYFGKDSQFLLNTAAVNNGGLLYQYITNTTTLANTYTTVSKGTANDNPMTLSSSGRLAQDVYIDQSMTFVLKDSSSNTLWTVNDITATDQLWTTVSKSTDYTVLETDRDKLIKVDASGAARTITLIAAATAGDGFKLGVKKTDSSSNTITIDGNASETIDGATTIVLRTQYDSIMLVCDGSNWHIEQAHNQVLMDTNGNEVLILGTTASAVNEFTMTNAATGNAPILQSSGEANIGMKLSDSNSNEVVILGATASAVNEITIANAASGNAPTITGSGTDADVGIVITPKEGSRTTTSSLPLTLRATTTGTPAAGIGTGVKFQAESADENPSDFGQIEFCATDVTAGSEDTYFDILTRVAGAALTKVWRFIATGAFKGIITHANTADRTYTFPDTDITQHLVQMTNTDVGSVATGTTVIPDDDTIPQITEGDQYMTLAITPKSASNILYITVVLHGSSSNNGDVVAAALFQDATANALAVGFSHTAGLVAASQVHNIVFIHKMTAGTTSATTFRVRAGVSTAGTLTFNGAASSGKYGNSAGTISSSITIMEVSP